MYSIINVRMSTYIDMYIAHGFIYWFIHRQMTFYWNDLRCVYTYVGVYAYVHLDQCVCIHIIRCCLHEVYLYAAWMSFVHPFRFARNIHVIIYVMCLSFLYCVEKTYTCTYICKYVYIWNTPICLYMIWLLFASKYMYMYK